MQQRLLQCCSCCQQQAWAQMCTQQPGCNTVTQEQSMASTELLVRSSGLYSNSPLWRNFLLTTSTTNLIYRIILSSVIIIKASSSFVSLWFNEFFSLPDQHCSYFSSNIIKLSIVCDLWGLSIRSVMQLNNNSNSWLLQLFHCRTLIAATSTAELVTLLVNFRHY